YGGEEFVVVLPGVTNENAMKAAWQVQEKMAATPFVTDGLEIAVTVSLGVASRSADAAALPDIIKNADKALYHAKETGRNRVVSYEAMPVS
ncbi:MAG: GGDEF domain-containing protein, partial [Treponema sp.]|nr:GGDEF domain-containing protein [Treponema sp.]